MKIHYGAQYVERISRFKYGFTPGKVYKIEEWKNPTKFAVRNDMGKQYKYTVNYMDEEGEYIWQDAWMKNLKNILEE